MKKYLFLITSLIGSFFLLPSRVSTLARTMPVETPPTVVSQLPISQLHQIAQAITVKVYVGDTAGSGTLIQRQGQVYTVLTNAHVVTRGNSYRIQTPDGKIHQAILKISGNTPDTDLALLEFSASESYSTASLDLDPNLSSQQAVYAAGFPFDRSDLVFNNGQISFIAPQPIRGGYQLGFTNQIIQGMSGGALLDSYGRVIGILGLRKFPVLNTAYTYQDGTVPEPKTLQQMRQFSFAVPINYLGAIQPRKSLTKDQSKSTNLAYQTPYTGIVGKVDTIAQQITVRIDNKDSDSNGSGVIVARNNNTYYVLTAKHVICTASNSEQCTSNGNHQIVTPDGAIHHLDNSRIEANQSWLDIAIISFESSNDYEVATISNYQTKDDTYQTKDDLTFLSGFPANKQTANGSRIVTGGILWEKDAREFLTKDLFSLSQSNENYGLFYSNISHPGMSGGVVLDAEGRLIGINTSAEQEPYYEIDNFEVEIYDIGYSIGISSIDFVNYLSQNETEFKLDWLNISTNPLEELKSSEIASFANQLFKVKAPKNNNNLLEWMNYGNHLRRYGRYEEAVKAFEKIITIYPEFDQAYYAMSWAYWDQGKDKQAIVALKNAIKIDSKKYHYWRLLGQSYGELELYENAIEAYEIAIELRSEDFVLHKEYGDLMFKIGHYQSAVESFNLAQKINPKNSWIYVNRGVAYSELELHEAAIEDYTQAISINPHEAKTFLNRGIAYNKLGNYRAAIEDYTQAISINPQYSNVYYNRGTVYAFVNEHEKAIADFTQAISINSQDAQAFYNRGNSYGDLEKYEAAISDYTQAIAIDPKIARAFYNRGVKHLILKNFEFAKKDIIKAAELYSSQGNDQKYQEAVEFLNTIEKERIRN